jgi:hypothetical protein
VIAAAHSAQDCAADDSKQILDETHALNWQNRSRACNRLGQSAVLEGRD